MTILMQLLSDRQLISMKLDTEQYPRSYRVSYLIPELPRGEGVSERYGVAIPDTLQVPAIMHFNAYLDNLNNFTTFDVCFESVPDGECVSEVNPHECTRSEIATIINHYKSTAVADEYVQHIHQIVHILNKNPNVPNLLRIMGELYRRGPGADISAIPWCLSQYGLVVEVAGITLNGRYAVTPLGVDVYRVLSCIQ